MIIQLLLTGNELMSGHTVDSNSAVIAEKLLPFGYRIHKKTTVGDDRTLLISELTNMIEQSNVVIVNGGLGPTVDDLTAEILATVLKDELEEKKVAVEHLTEWCARIGIELSDENLKQAFLPSLSQIIPNPIGSAVGFYAIANDCLVICTPGVPSELNAMLDESIVDLIIEHFPLNTRAYTLRLQTYGLGESSVQRLVNQELSDWPESVELSFRAGFPNLELKISVCSEDDIPLQKHWEQRLRDKIGDYIIGTESCSLQECVIDLLRTHGKTITTIESCTGGLIASQLTQIAGASDVFEAGFVTYSNSIKQRVVAVDEHLLAQHGAVSEEVVLAMARGGLELSSANYAIAVSGIAGPGGGSDEKPVGTVWIAWGTADKLKTMQLVIKGNRLWFQKRVAAICLDLIRRELDQIESEPLYLARNRPK